MFHGIHVEIKNILSKYCMLYPCQIAVPHFFIHFKFGGKT